MNYNKVKSLKSRGKKDMIFLLILTMFNVETNDNHYLFSF